MDPYYQDEHITLYHGDCQEIMQSLKEQSVNAVITDPPYTERTHDKARSKRHKENGKHLLNIGVSAFSAITDDDLRVIMSECGRVSQSWVIATLDYKHAVEFDIDPPNGLKCQRIGVWVKTNPTPQITGDRPAQGWEAIAYLHRSQGRSRWNGKGGHGNYVLPIAGSEGHPTAKPIPMIRDMVRKFTNPGDTVLDPFAGSGTTLRAAVDEGRRAIGVELEERYCEIIAKRLAQGALDLGI